MTGPRFRLNHSAKGAVKQVGRLTEMDTAMLRGGVGAGRGSSSTARGAGAPEALVPPTPK